MDIKILESKICTFTRLNLETYYYLCSLIKVGCGLRLYNYLLCIQGGLFEGGTLI